MSHVDGQTQVDCFICKRLSLGLLGVFSPYSAPSGGDIERKSERGSLSWDGYGVVYTICNRFWKVMSPVVRRIDVGQDRWPGQVGQSHSTHYLHMLLSSYVYLSCMR